MQQDLDLQLILVFLDIRFCDRLTLLGRSRILLEDQQLTQLSRRCKVHIFSGLSIIVEFSPLNPKWVLCNVRHSCAGEKRVMVFCLFFFWMLRSSDAIEISR